MKKLLGAVLGLSLLVSGAALAQSDIDSNSGVGGSGSSSGMGGSTGSTGSTVGSTGSESGSTQQMEGRVIKSSGGSLTIEHMGAAIPFTVTRNTQFQGVKSAKDIKEGQQIRASFDLKNDKNELRSVEVLGTGGSGSEDQSGTTGSSSKSNKSSKKKHDSSSSGSSTGGSGSY